MIRIDSEKISDYLHDEEYGNDDSIEELIAKIKSSPFGIANFMQKERERAICKAIDDIENSIEELSGWLNELNEIVLIKLAVEKKRGTTSFGCYDVHIPAFLAIALNQALDYDEGSRIVIDNEAYTKSGRGCSYPDVAKDVLSEIVNHALERMFDFEGVFRAVMEGYEQGGE